MFLLRVTGALSEARVPYALVGGYAVAFHGAVRGTVDIDIVLRFSERDFRRAESALAGLSLRSRLPVTGSEIFRFRREYIRSRNLTAWSFVNPAHPSEIVDVVLTHDLARMKIKRIRVQGRIVKIASIDDLIRMKAGSRRAQDIEDVKALRRVR